MEEIFTDLLNIIADEVESLVDDFMFLVGLFLAMVILLSGEI